jgi:cell wall-associated NlpC family hydrolase
MVSDALTTVGVSWYDWPVGAYRLGPVVPLSEAQPGDLLYYVNGAGTSVAGLAHIAVYIGNGKAVHGGFNVNQTVVWSVNVGYNPTVPPTAVIRVL